MSDLSGISVVLPSLDPDEKLITVIKGLIQIGFTDIILVNDGSKPENLHYFEDASLYPEVHLLQHPVNLGKGAALKTAFNWFLENRPDGQGVVTVDGDNQHSPEDTLACVRQMQESGHVILGVRDFSLPQVPFRSRYGNRITSGVFRIFCGMTISDTQTGLRAIPSHALPVFVKVGGDRFEYETNMLLAMKENNIDFEEVKCRTIYIEENKSSHFSAVVDEGLFTLLSWLLRKSMSGLLLTAVPTITARVISSLLNFFMNKKLVFRSNAETGKSMARYYMLAIPQLLLQLSLTHGMFLLFDIGEEKTVLRALIYALVMTLLFIVSFVIQQRWVFRSRRAAQEEKQI